MQKIREIHMDKNSNVTSENILPHCAYCGNECFCEQHLKRKCQNVGVGPELLGGMTLCSRIGPGGHLESTDKVQAFMSCQFDSHCN